jgi:hypothetical protein
MAEDAETNPPTPKLSVEALQLPDADLARSAFAEAEDSLAQAGGEYMSKVHLLPPVWRMVWALLKLNDEVSNGGFHQFFTNMGGVLDSHLADDIARIEHEGYRSILTRANEAYSKIDYQDQWDNRGKSWDYFAAPYKEGRFRDEDEEFYSTKPDFDEVIGQHVRQHATDYTSDE